MADNGNIPEPTPEASSAQRPDRSHGPGWPVLAPVAVVFTLLVTGGVIAAYRYGEGVIFIGERTISDFNVFEVTGGAAIGVVGMVFGLGAAVIGAIASLAAAIIGVSVGVLGAALGLFVVVGVVTGPLLLIGVIAILIKRRYWPDVI